MINKQRCLAFVGVSFIILAQYSSYGYFLLQVFSFSYPLTSLILFVLLSTLVLMIFWPYSFAVFKDPGYIPLNKEDQIEISEHDIEESKKKSFRMKEKVSEPITNITYQMKELNKRLRESSKKSSSTTNGSLY